MEDSSTGTGGVGEGVGVSAGGEVGEGVGVASGVVVGAGDGVGAETGVGVAVAIGVGVNNLTVELGLAVGVEGTCEGDATTVAATVAAVF